MERRQSVRQPIRDRRRDRNHARTLQSIPLLPYKTRLHSSVPGRSLWRYPKEKILHNPEYNWNANYINSGGHLRQRA